jgi:hypothetical protein
MQPHIQLNWVAILASVFASFAFGSIWYGPLFAKTWQKAMGFSEAQKPTGAEIAKGSILNVIGTFLTAFVLAHIVQVWKPSSWNLSGDGPAYLYGVYAGFFTWIGFVVPVLLNGVAFERKPWKVFFIGAGAQLISLQIIGQILANWR